jgi:hypothetical protein
MFQSAFRNVCSGMHLHRHITFFWRVYTCAVNIEQSWRGYIAFRDISEPASKTDEDVT